MSYFRIPVSIGRFLLAGLLCVLAGTRASAQWADATASTPLKVGAQARATSTSSTVSISVQADNGLMTGYGYATSGSSWFNSTPIYPAVKPSATYNVTVRCDYVNSLTLSFAAAPGFETRIGGIARQSVRESPSSAPAQYFYYEVVVIPSSTDEASRAGTCSSLEPDKILWRVSMGNLSNGQSAQAISLCSSGLGDWSSLFQPSALIYSSPSEEVQVYSPSGVLSQVFANQALANIVVDSSSAYEIQFYNRSQVTGSGFPHGLTGAPYVKYKIEQTGTNHLQITSYQYGDDALTNPGAAVVRQTVTDIQSTNGTWTMNDWHTVGNSAPRIATTVMTTNGNLRSEVVTIANASGTVAQKTQKVFQTFSWGEALTQLTLDYGGQNLTTTYAYGSDTSKPGNYASLLSVTYPSGSWEAFDYYDDFASWGLLLHRYRPYLDAPSTVTTNLALGRCTTYAYSEDPDGGITRPWHSRTDASGQRVSESYTEYRGVIPWSDTSGSFPVVVTDRFDYTDLSSNGTVPSAHIWFYRENSADPLSRGQPLAVEHSDSTQDIYKYEHGTYNAGNHAFTTSNSFANGAASRVTVTHGALQNVPLSPYVGTEAPSNPDNPSAVDYKSTKEVTIRDANANLVRSETYAYTGSLNYTLVASVDYTYNGANQLVSRVTSNNQTYQYTYSGELKTAEIDDQGIETDYSYDAAGRVLTATKKGVAAASGYAAQGDIVTMFTYDAEGRITQSQTSGGGQTLTSQRQYDAAGRTTSESAPGGYSTTFTYPNSGRDRSVTYPGGATRVESHFADGRIKSITGTAQVATYYSYSIDGAGLLWTKENRGNASSGNWHSQGRDWTGRLVVQRRPDQNGNAVDTTYSYDQYSMRLSKQATNGIAALLYGYDDTGVRQLVAQDTNNNNTVDLSGSDRITKSDVTFTTDGTGWWRTTIETVYATANSSTATQVQRTDERLTGFAANVISNVKKTDASGNTTSTSVTVDRSSRLVTTSTTVPGSNSPIVSVSYNGLAVATTNDHGLTTRYLYDGLGRVAQEIDPRTGGVLTEYVSGTSYVARTAYVTGGTNIAVYSYTSEGRVATVTDAAGHVTRFAYDGFGNVTNQWGDGCSPVRYVYDSFGRLTQQSTYRAGSGWSGTSWPSGAEGTADTTTYIYYGDTDFVSAKQDAAARQTSFSYDSLGRMSQRTDARGVTTNYTYDSSTGDLTRINYLNDPNQTPENDFSYTRAGLPNSVTDAAGTRSFGYRSDDFQLSQENLPNHYGAGRFLRYNYETSSNGVAGRSQGFSIGDSGGAASVQGVSFGYSADGRINSIAGNGAGFSSYSFAYGYQSQSDNLIASIANSATGYTLTRAFDSQRDLVTSVASQYGATTTARYDYTYNTLNQRTTAKQSGTAFADYVQPSFYVYGYSARGELTDAYGYTGTDVTDQSHPMSGRLNHFGFDNAGNRTDANHTGVAGLQENYTSNNLNQTTQRENHTVPVQGSAAAGSSVTVTSGSANTAGRSANYWGSEAQLNNTSGPAAATVQVKATLNVGGTNYVRQNSVSAFIPPSVEQLTYDANGNLTADGVWNYWYDAENRLVRMETNSATMAVKPPGTAITFLYDYLGRRVSKKVYTWSGTWTFQSERRFLYNGHDLVAELDGNGNALRHFVWGLDAQGAMDAVGANGALLMIQDGSHTYFPAYDGSGNVAALMDAANGGSLAAIYEYSPSGQLLRREGSYAAANPFRWGSKYFDQETGLINFGFRYFSPSLGRFINRDPIGEDGGLNLYAFAGNDFASGTDVLGLYPPVVGVTNVTFYDADPVMLPKFYANATPLHLPQTEKVETGDPLGLMADLEFAGAHYDQSSFMESHTRYIPVQTVGTDGLKQMIDQQAKSEAKRLQAQVKQEVSGHIGVEQPAGAHRGFFAKLGEMFLHTDIFREGADLWKESSRYTTGGMLLSRTTVVFFMGVAVVDTGLNFVGGGAKAAGKATIEISEKIVEEGVVKLIAEASEKAAVHSAEATTAQKTAANATRGWKTGEPINNLTLKGKIPSWSTIRQRFWKNEALKNPGTYSKENIARMQRGLAPQRINPRTGALESMELHHTPAQRDGGLFDVEKVWPDDHAAIDPFRHTGD